MAWGQAGRVAPGVRVTAWPARSAANVKKWEMELQTLRESNARLTSALQESAASLEQWKRQFSVCRDENDRLRNKVGARVPGVLSASLAPPPSLAPPRGGTKRLPAFPSRNTKEGAGFVRPRPSVAGLGWSSRGSLRGARSSWVEDRDPEGERGQEI